MTSRILIFSSAMGAYVKFIATEATTFSGYIISVLASVSLFKEIDDLAKPQQC